MEITQINVEGYENVVEAIDRSIDFHAIIAVHNTILGPALGGCRLWNYKNREEGLEDVLRLSEGMTYKAACAGLNLGGGKSIILGEKKSEAIFLAMGEFVETLGGKYITAEDVGTCVEDMQIISKKTKYVTGLSKGEGSSGDPSPFTALGVFEGLKAGLESVYGHQDFSNITVAMQGAGHVGTYLCEHLHKAGAKLIVTDIDEAKAKQIQERFSAEIVALDEIYDVNCDIFSPAALGGVINDDTIHRLKCKIVGGPSNNQLLEKKHADELQEKGILYLPDFVLNGGGLINVYAELDKNGYQEEKATKQVQNIYKAIQDILNFAKDKNYSTAKAAHEFALERLSQARS